MEYKESKEKSERTVGKKLAQSSHYTQSQKFIPPTHPAYVVAPNFEAPHITKLQEVLDKHYIAMGMQTSKKKLMRMPNMPTDRFFIVADDTQGKPHLEGQFLTLRSKVVHYPRANSAQEVVATFKEYIGLGHYETSEQYFQLNAEQMKQKNNLQLLRERARISPTNSQLQLDIPKVNIQPPLVNLPSSLSPNPSKIELREVSTLQEDERPVVGRLFVYQNKKDTEQYKNLVALIRQKFVDRAVTYIQRIDEYNYYLRVNRERDNIILMSQYTFANLSQYFQKYKAFVVFMDESDKINFYNQKNVALFTSNQDRILQFVAGFVDNKSKSRLSAIALEECRRLQLNASPPNLRAQKMSTLGLGYQSPSISIFEGKDKSKSKLQVFDTGSSILRANSPRGRPRIQLVKVTDLDKKQIQEFKLKACPPVQANNPPPQTEEKKSIQPPILNQPPQLQKNQTSIPPSAQEDIRLESNIEFQENKQQSDISQKSKIKRLKSKKTTQERQEFYYPVQTQIQPVAIPPTSKDSKRPNSLVKSHLRMGSDDNHSRAHLRSKLLTHQRARSDEISPLKVCITSPKPSGSESSESEQSSALEQQQPKKYTFAQIEPPETQAKEKEGEQKGKRQQRSSILKSRTYVGKTNQEEISTSVKQVNLEDPPKLMTAVSCPPPKNQFQPIPEPIVDMPEQEQEETRVRKRIPTGYPGLQLKRLSKLTSQKLKTQLQVLQQEDQEMNMVRKNNPHGTHRTSHRQTSEQVQATQGEQKENLATTKPKDVRKLHNRNQVKAAEDYYTASQKTVVSTGSAHPVKKVRPLAVAPIFQNNELLSNDQIDIPQISSDISSIKHAGRKQQKRPTYDNKEGRPQQSEKIKEEYGLVRGKDDDKGRKIQLKRSQYPEQHIMMVQQKIDPPSSTQEKPKLKSLSHVNKIFNRSSIKPAIQQAHHIRNPSYSKSNKSDIERRPFKVGKIYSNKSRLSTINTNAPNTPHYSSLSTPHANTRYSSYLVGYSNPSTQGQLYYPRQSDGAYTSRNPYEVNTRDVRVYRNKSIEELIDLTKYERVVENGIVVYRSKQPIQMTYYNPSVVSVTQPAANYYQPFKESINTINLQTNQSPNVSIVSSYPINYTQRQQNPYEIQRPKETSKVKPILRPSWTKPQEKQNELRRSKSGRGLWRKEKEVRPTLKTEYRGEFVQENVGVQVEADPFNSLGNLNNQEVLNSSKPSNNPKSASRPLLCKAIQSTLNPIQDLLASKVSNSKSVAPQKVLNWESPNCAADSGDQSLSEEQSQSREHGADQRTVLYLIEKTQTRHLFDALSALKTKRDSLITFKSEKQLSQQIAQTTHVYDLVYVLPANPSTGIEEIVRTQPNCYLVEIGEGKTKVKGNRIEVSDPSHLKDVSELLLKHLAKPKQSHKKVQDACVCKKGLMKSPKGCWHSHVCCSMRHPCHS